MKPHRILKDFPGSQNGNDHKHFKADTTVDLSDALAAIVVKEGWAEPLETDPEKKSEGNAPFNKAKKAAPANKAKKASDAEAE